MSKSSIARQRLDRWYYPSITRAMLLECNMKYMTSQYALNYLVFQVISTVFSRTLIVLNVAQLLQFLLGRIIQFNTCRSLLFYL